MRVQAALGEDAARFPRVPTRCQPPRRQRISAPGRDPRLQGPVVRGGRSQCGDGRVTHPTLESPARATQRSGLSQTRRLPALFVTQLTELARCSPASTWPRVVHRIANAPWHRGLAVTQGLAALPPLAWYR
jgi:hypothetical protein